MITSKVPRMIYGGDYNPEQWPEEVWQEDVRLMREAGVNLVSLGIFAWAKLEPRPASTISPGSTGSSTCCTRTAWGQPGHGHRLATALARRLHPEILPVTRTARALAGRPPALLPQQPRLPRAGLRLVRRIAERYKDHPALALWHVNNEYACHVAVLLRRLGRALPRLAADRYGDLDALNEAWGTAFWSQQYGDWGEILPPRRAHLPEPEPAARLAPLLLRRLARAATRSSGRSCAKSRRACRSPPTSWAFSSRSTTGSGRRGRMWSPDDSLPGPLGPRGLVEAAMSHDLMRSLGGGALGAHGADHRPGQLARANVPSGRVRCASGASGPSPAARTGSCSSSGANPGRAPRSSTARWSRSAILEIAQLARGEADSARISARLDELPGRGGRPRSRSCSTGRAGGPRTRLQTLHRLRLLEGVYSFYKPLYGSNIPVDFVHPESDLSSYRLVIAPDLYLVTDASAHNILQVRGRRRDAPDVILLGIVDAHDHIRLADTLPRSGICSAFFEDFVPMATGETNRLDAENEIFAATCGRTSST